MLNNQETDNNSAVKQAFSSSVDTVQIRALQKQASKQERHAKLLRSNSSNSSALKPTSSNSVNKSIASTSTRGRTPLRHNEIIDERNKRAAEWLHGEQLQVLIGN